MKLNSLIDKLNMVHHLDKKELSPEVIQEMAGEIESIINQDLAPLFTGEGGTVIDAPSPMAVELTLAELIITVAQTMRMLGMDAEGAVETMTMLHTAKEIH
ncbi:hypothetical protein NVP1262O_38 [Vibrio phage 1.262.O._10N.286.51.A9]|nr:hypothetical protein NVP1262O_38 [Vibrio phage 1.262.O._10N.286.51.A9]